MIPVMLTECDSYFSSDKVNICMVTLMQGTHSCSKSIIISLFLLVAIIILVDATIPKNIEHLETSKRIGIEPGHVVLSLVFWQRGLG